MVREFSKGCGKGKKAVLFKSIERFEAFKSKLEFYRVDYTILDFDGNSWMDFDYSQVDFAIYYPSFEYSSSSPMALYKVYDNIAFLRKEYPNLAIYPDPGIIRYYNDKYRQYLFLKNRNFPIPDTIPLHSEKEVACADADFGYPMILKNRYGAGGGSVYKVENRKELEKYFHLSRMDIFNLSACRYFLDIFSKKLFW